MEYEDEAIDRRILIRYAGDAKFKGVRSSLPVYEAELRGAGVARGAALHAVEVGLRDDRGPDPGLRAVPRPSTGEDGADRLVVHRGAS